jgi:hypothetical protein
LKMMGILGCVIFVRIPPFWPPPCNSSAARIWAGAAGADQPWGSRIVPWCSAQRRSGMRRCQVDTRAVFPLGHVVLRVATRRCMLAVCSWSS